MAAGLPVRRPKWLFRRKEMEAWTRVQLVKTENVRCKNLFRREKKNIQDVRQRDAPKITPVSDLPN